MLKSDLLKVLFSLPIILVVFYFTPFLGIIMLIARKFIIGKSKYPIGMIFIAITTIIVIPKFINYIFGLLNINNISYIDDILNSDIYPVLLSRAKLLFILGIIALIASAISKKLRTSAINGITSYFKSMQEDEGVFEDNDLLTNEKQEKNTHFVKCPNCGTNNVIHGENGKCAFCKSNLEYK